jgi:hypothetical protein
VHGILPLQEKPLNLTTKLLAAAILLATPSFANILVINDTDSPIRFPFGTDSTSATNYKSGATYQQIYDASEFSNTPILISQVAFSTSSIISNATSATLGLDVHLGVAGSSAANPSTTFSANRGSNYQDVFDATLTFTPALNNTFDMVLNLSTPFLYDPSKGDLLLDVSLTQASAFTGTALYFGGDSSPTDDRIFNANPSTTGTVDFNTLATQFTFTSAASAPEPSTVFLLGAGIGSLVLLRKRTKA